MMQSNSERLKRILQDMDMQGIGYHVPDVGYVPGFIDVPTAYTLYVFRRRFERVMNMDGKTDAEIRRIVLNDIDNILNPTYESGEE